MSIAQLIANAGSAIGGLETNYRSYINSFQTGDMTVAGMMEANLKGKNFEMISTALLNSVDKLFGIGQKAADKMGQ